MCHSVVKEAGIGKYHFCFFLCFGTHVHDLQSDVAAAMPPMKCSAAPITNHSKILFVHSVFSYKREDLIFSVCLALRNQSVPA